MSAIASAKALRMRAAGAPSMIWWSTVSDRPIRCSSTTVPSGPAAARGTIASTPRMATCGALSTGVKDSTPKAPRLLTVKVAAGKLVGA